MLKSLVIRVLKLVGLRKELTLSKRYPQFTFGRETYGNLQIRDFMEQDDVEVGSFTSIAPGVQILLGADHRVDWVTTYPFNINWKQFKDVKGHPKSNGAVRIGSDVWIGLDAVIMSGVTIGDGAVIGARALVNEDIPPYSIAVGMPAKVIKYRFTSDIIDRLLAIRWWGWSEDKLERAMPDLLSEKITFFCESAEAGVFDE